MVYVVLSFANIIPYSQPVSFILSFTYPLSNEKPFSLILQITVSANETIAEHVPVRISNIVGTMTLSLARNVSSAAVCFNGALLTGYLPIGYPCAGTLLLETNLHVPGLPMYLDGPSLVGEDSTIEWHVEGDYYATLVLYLQGGTRVLENYTQNRVHVQPAFVLEEEKGSKHLQTLEVAGFVFASTWLISFAEQKLGERKDGSIGRLERDAYQVTNGPARESECDTGRKEGKKSSVQQEHHEKRRKQHQPSSNAKE